MPETHHREFSELPLTVDRDSDTPLPAQLAGALREAIDRDTLRPGEPVPATRALAARLGVARGVVVAAYQQLIAEGYLSAGHGRGTRVHPQLHPQSRSIERDPGGGASAPEAASAAGSVSGVRSPSGPGSPSSSESGSGSSSGSGSGAPATGISSPGPESPQREPHPRERPARPDEARPRADRSDRFGVGVAQAFRPLAPGLPDTSAVDTPAWRAAWRRALSRAHLEAPALGDPRLREEISEHLRRMRGTNRAPSDVIVTAGAREGLSLLLTALAQQLGRPSVVGVEDPGYPSLRRVAARHSARIVALPVDGEGLVTSELPRGVLDAVVVTPSHQYPLGGSLPLVRRRELLDWASRDEAVIVEDDYDSELRHTGSPLPALAALDDPVDGRVVLLGTFSKTVSQALAAGYLLAPAGLRAVLEPVRRDIGGPVSAVVQTALAEYLASGELRRHTARMRRRYAMRRELVVERLFGVPGVRVRPMSGGLHAVLSFSGGAGAFSGGAGVQGSAEAAEAAVAGPAAELGAVPLSAYWHSHAAAGDRYGLVIGTGGSLEDEEFSAALDALRGMLERDRRPGA